MNDEEHKEKYLKWTLFPYFGSWVFGLAMMVIAGVGTAVARRTIDPSIELVPKTLLDFNLEFNQIYIWVVVAWLLGPKTGVRIMELFVELRTGRSVVSSLPPNPEQTAPEQSESTFREINEEIIRSRKNVE